MTGFANEDERILAMRLAASEAGVDRRHATEGEFIADKYGTVRFRRLDTLGRYIDDPDEE